MLRIILFIVLLLLIVKYFTKKEGMKPQDKKKKILICYYGGSFREGKSGSSTHSTESGYNNQYYATQSHIKLNKLFNEKGYEVNTLIHTYHSKYEDKLNKWYDPYDFIYKVINPRLASVKGRDNLISSTIKNIKNITPNDYDHILFIRIDLFLKPDFFKIVNVLTEKINFLAHNFYTGHCGFTDNKDPEVVDLILLVPKKYFYILDDKFKLNHNAWSYYKKTYKLTNDDMTFMSDLRFDSNSYLDYNPYYIISGRPENKKAHNTEKTNPNVYGQIGNKRGKDCQLYVKSEKGKDEYLQDPAAFYFNIHKDYYE
uniref:Nucleotide-diphospho-sugar transferase domain-containing protein n=1 Tax=viral metagenome TaxID=1070528 RepID=A0A6C0ESZ0_9ZZZZ